MHSEEEERRSLQLLHELRSELANSLDSLGGRMSRGLLDNYYFHSAKYVNRAAEGFVFLRESGRTDASALLVRPVIEVTLRVEAVRRNAEILYRIAFTEHDDDTKWFRKISENNALPYDETEAAQQWARFTAEYAAQFPSHDLQAKRLGIEGVAIKAQLGAYYDSHYRTYCRHSHAALRSMGDSLSELTDAEDNRVMGLSVFTVLNALNEVGTCTDRLPEFHERLKG